MKTGVITVCLLVLFALEANAVYAKEAQEYRAEADQYYAANNYRKAYKNYLKLAKQGDQFQWGGERLCADRTFATADGKAHFQSVSPPDLGAPPAADTFLLATRRGKQFNSMVQQQRDPLTGAERDHIFVAAADAERLGLRTDQAIVVRNDYGSFHGRVFVAQVAPGTLQGHWPELQPLIPHGRVDPLGGVPDYNARVRVEKA